jgi:hypothetical protein
LTVILREDPIQKRRFAGPQKARENRDRNAIGFSHE